ncbi:MAG: ribose 1,5-bisphosphate isomerase [Desulfurococcaceae archaeon]
MTIPEIPQIVLQIANDIKVMKIRGAGKIARSAAEALKQASINYKGPYELAVFKKYMGRVADILISTRPTAVSLPNAVIYVISGLLNAGSYKDAHEIVVERAERFIKQSLEAVDKASKIGAKRIRENSVVLTHCHSTAAVKTIIEAYKLGKVVKAYSTETRPFYQGRITSTQLLENNVPVIQIPDSAIRYVMHEVDHVVIGADTVTAIGEVVNKIGTSQVAAVAKEHGVPVQVIAESYKFSPMTLMGDPVVIEFRDPREIVPEEWLNKHPGIEVLNPSFDITPPRYIDAIVTENGVIPPYAAILVLKEMWGWVLEEMRRTGLGYLRFEEIL